MGNRSVEHWFDTLAELWAGVEDGAGQRLTSYKVFSKNELPSVPILAANAPCVASYVDDCMPQYSEGGPTLLKWLGVSEFHITKDVKPSNMAEIMLYYERIIAAAAADMQLGGKVAIWSIVQEQQGAMTNVTFRNHLTSEPDHQGILVKWEVLQDVSGLYTVSR